MDIDFQPAAGWACKGFNMPLWIILVLVAVLLVAWTLIPGIKHWRYRQAIRARPPANKQWEAEFAQAMPSVEQVLMIFCDAFLFSSHDRWQFRPDDRLIDVYKGTTGSVSDEMQLETLMGDIDESFGVDLADDFDEHITLRDIATRVTQQKTPEK